MDLREVPRRPFARHPWELARRDLFARILGDAGLSAAPQSVLDVGAGDGWLGRELLALLPAGSQLTLWDAGYPGDARHGAIRTCNTRPSERFSLVLCLDVLEHVADDAPFLGQIVEDNLLCDGHLIMSVPAWQRLFSAHDRALAHHRRYDPEDARQLLNAAGLSVERSGSAFLGLFLVRAVAVALERLDRSPSARSPELRWHWGERSATLVRAALDADIALCQALSGLGPRPPGLSLWALCSCAKR